MTDTKREIEKIINKVRTVEFLHGVPVSLPSETVELLRSGIRGAIAQAEKSGKDQMREALGCICKNLAPASVHFKDCPLGKCTQALAEEREKVEYMRNSPPPYPADKENPMKHIYQNEGYGKALDDILSQR